MKADISGYVYLAFVVMVGVLAIVLTFKNMDPLQSPESRSLELATKIALYLDSLSTVEEGSVILETGNYKYYIEVQKKGSTWRSIAKDFLPKFIDKYIDKKGFYVAITPILENGISNEEKKGESAAFIINSYNFESNYHKLFESEKRICLVKDKDNIIAEVNEC